MQRHTLNIYKKPNIIFCCCSVGNGLMMLLWREMRSCMNYAGNNKKELHFSVSYVNAKSLYYCDCHIFFLHVVSFVLLGCYVNFLSAQTSHLADQNRRFSTTV